MHEGGCFCDHVRYRMTAEPMFVTCCHCRDCQKLTGSAFAVNAMIESDRVEVTSVGQPVTAGDVDKDMRCPECKVLLWATHRMYGDPVLFVRVGTLDRADLINPDAHFFVSRSHPWVTIPPDLPAFAELPGPDDPPLMSDKGRQRLAAAMGRG